MKLLKQAEYMTASRLLPSTQAGLHKRVRASLDALRNALVTSTAIIGLALLATDLDQIDSARGNGDCDSNCNRET